jgi:hypothetical protein
MFTSPKVMIKTPGPGDRSRDLERRESGRRQCQSAAALAERTGLCEGVPGRAAHRLPPGDCAFAALASSALSFESDRVGGRTESRPAATVDRLHSSEPDRPAERHA